MSNTSDLDACRVIFRAGQCTPTPGQIEADHPVHQRMTELYHILQSYAANGPDLEEDIHWVAILGAVARLFEALSNEPAFEEILTAKFKNSARRLIYHSRNSFSSSITALVSAEAVIRFFIHCYEHCRHELATTGMRFGALDQLNLKMDMLQPWFHAVMHMGSTCVDERVADSEIKFKASASITTGP